MDNQKINGFTKEYVNNIFIQNELNIDSNGDGTPWVIQEDADTSDLNFKYDGTTVFTIDTSGGVGITGSGDFDDLTVGTDVLVVDGTAETIDMNADVVVDGTLQTPGFGYDLSPGPPV